MDIGQVAYEAYGQTVGWVTHGGDRMPAWNDQSERLREAWRASADAVLMWATRRPPGEG